MDLNWYTGNFLKMTFPSSLGCIYWWGQPGKFIKTELTPQIIIILQNLAFMIIGKPYNSNSPHCTCDFNDDELIHQWKYSKKVSEFEPALWMDPIRSECSRIQQGTICLRYLKHNVCYKVPYNKQYPNLHNYGVFFVSYIPPSCQATKTFLIGLPKNTVA